MGMMLARKIGLPMPKAAFLNAFPAPHLPYEKRPWHSSRKLSDKELQDELRNWDKEHLVEGPGKVVFDENQWGPTYGLQMKSDFPIFDEYRFSHNGAAKFDLPLHCWHMGREHYNKADMIELWKDWTTAKFDHKTLDMGHLTCFYQPDKKTKYFGDVVALMKEYTSLIVLAMHR